MIFAARLFLVMVLSLGLLLPRVSVMLAEVTGAERVLLCDGSSMVVLALSEDGTPQHIAHDDPCGLLAADIPPALPATAVSAVELPLRHARRRRSLALARRIPRAHGPRAPPICQLRV